ncbi:phosphoethanolamine n-methyltransferase 3 [Fusarium heterosporum]|uniref:Phosphoethanolamine n-methyltransferase 3 n=1 Tax=Fusarium heterosporum TaxID=42747 RepID=A0A8H5WN20_FUSHE|nr:phosphoethanolamine n-methyltransferase 3 [Fusarium heterosporum]
MSTSTVSATAVPTHQFAETSPQAIISNLEEQPLEYGSNSDENSAFIDGPHLSAASVVSSILEYRNSKGRARHFPFNDSGYPFPTDDQALENFDLMHHFSTLLTDDKLFLAPVEDNVQTVLDVGTGTGLWAIDFAEEHPNTTVIGTDLSAVQSDYLPPNLTFQADDCTGPWRWDKNTFDFVHMRYLFGAITDWNALFREAYEVTRPGGWVESCESEPMTHSDDGTIADDGSTALGGIWDKVFIEGGKTTGCSLSVLSDDLQTKAMEEAGFVDIHETIYKVPFGSWPANKKLAEIGQYAKLSLESDLIDYSEMIWREVLKWPAEECQLFLDQVRDDFRNRELHPYFKIRFVWGRKPGEA